MRSVCLFLIALLLVNCENSEQKTFSRDKINISAHRGGAFFAPENTLLAIRNCMQFNPNRIEIDVHQSKDGVLVIMHDYSINRMTNGKGKIKNLSYSEISSYIIDVQLKNTKTVEKAPTLTQVIRTINGKTKLLIEIKNKNNQYQNIEKNIVDTISYLNASSWCIIQSFDNSTLNEVHKFDPSLELHKLCLGKIPFLPIWLSNKIESESEIYNPYIAELSINQYLLTRSLIATLHQKKKKVNVWIVDNQRKAEQFIEKGVDGIITNRPNILDLQRY